MVSILIVGSTLAASQGWSATIRKATVVSDCPIQSSPDPASEIIGYYRKGTVVPVNFPDTEGYFEITFARPVKEYDKGYIARDHLELQSPAETRVAVKRREKRKQRREDNDKSSALAAVLEMHSVSPSKVQTALSLTPASVSYTAYGLEYHAKPKPGWTLGAGVTLYSLSQTVSGGIKYESKGYKVMGLVHYKLFRELGLDFKIGAGLGIALSSAGNSVEAVESETTNIASLLYRIQGVVEAPFSDNELALRLHFGYEALNLADVTIVQGANADGTTISETAAFEMTGPFFGFAFMIYF